MFLNRYIDVNKDNDVLWLIDEILIAFGIPIAIISLNECNLSFRF